MTIATPPSAEPGCYAIGLQSRLDMHLHYRFRPRKLRPTMQYMRVDDEMKR